MPSHRLPWFVSQNSYSREIESLRSAGVPLLDLSSSNPTTAGFNYPHRRIAAALADGSNYAYDPRPSGLSSAKRAIVSYYATRSIHIEPDRLLVTASTSEAYSYLFKMLCDPGDEILIPLPSYPLFEYLASLENVRTVPYRLRYDGSWHLDFASLHARLTDRTRAIVIVNPNNPTGSFLQIEEASRLLLWAREHELAIISDEVFLDYSIQPGLQAVPSLIGHTETLAFCLNGLSKTAGMPQLKLGWIAVDGPEDDARRALANLEVVADTYLSVSTPVQHALPELLAAGADMLNQIRTRVRSNFQALRSILKVSAANPLHTEAGWSAIVQLPRTRSEEAWLHDLLLNENVIVQPGYYFDMESEAYAVVSLITPEKEFQCGIEKLKRLVDRS